MRVAGLGMRVLATLVGIGFSGADDPDFAIDFFSMHHKQKPVRSE